MSAESMNENETLHRSTRFEAYQAINGERDFQDRFVIPARLFRKTHTLGEFIALISQYADQARAKWTREPDDYPAGRIDGFPESLHEVRKIAALAVSCMEQHGSPRRLTPKETA